MSIPSPTSPLMRNPSPHVSGLGVSHLTGYQGRRDWSDAYESAVMNIVARYVLRKGTITEDVTKGADLKSVHKNIGVRVRAWECYDKYPGEFTLRTPGELNKVTSGNTDWFFYGYAHPQLPTKLGAWMLIDMHVFRDEMRVNDQIRSSYHSNRVADGGFTAFDLRTFRVPDLIVGCSDNMVKRLGEWY